MMLDAGEIAAINLALLLRADILLIDERKGRQAAREAGLKVGGLLGELLYAKHKSWIPELKPEIARLRTEARFFVSPEIERLILVEAGEFETFG